MTPLRLIYAPPGKRLPPKRQRLAFLLAFAATGSVSFAAACAGVDRTTPYLWRDQDADFDRAWQAVRPVKPARGRDIPWRRLAQMNHKMLRYQLRREGARQPRFSTPAFPLPEREVPSGKGRT